VVRLVWFGLVDGGDGLIRCDELIEKRDPSSSCPNSVLYRHGTPVTSVDERHYITSISHPSLASILIARSHQKPNKSIDISGVNDEFR
jgi:hypothetical protein